MVSHDHQIIHQQVSPGDIANIEDYHDEAIEKNQCIKHKLPLEIQSLETLDIYIERALLHSCLQRVTKAFIYYK